MILYQDCSSHLDLSKNMAARGRGLFSLYIYIENFKNLLVRNHWTDFNIILQKCSFGDLLPRLFKPFGFVKNMAARGRGLFFLYIYIENFKNLLVRNHWTDFNITRQECFFCNLLGVVGWCEGAVYLTSLGRPTDIGLQLGKACYPCSG